MPKPPLSPTLPLIAAPHASSGSSSSAGHAAPPQTVPVEQLVEAARTGMPIDPPTSEPPVVTESAASPPQPEASHATPNQTSSHSSDQSSAGVKREPLPFYPQSADEMWRYAKNLALSDLLPRGLRNKSPDGKLLPGGKVADIYLVLDRKSVV